MQSGNVMGTVATLKFGVSPQLVVVSTETGGSPGLPGSDTGRQWVVLCKSLSSSINYRKSLKT